jgi:hypothetical protein
VLGLLVGFWVAGWFGAVVCRTQVGGFDVFLKFGSGGIDCGLRESRTVGGWSNGVNYSPPMSGTRRFMGSWHLSQDWLQRSELHVVLPAVALITCLIPFALGPFIRFRFRLWHYLVYTALIATELAYYLWWQE